MASLSEQEKHHTTPVSTYELIQHLPSYWPVWPNKKTPVAGALFVSFSDTGQWRWVQIVSVELPRQVVTYEAVKSFGFCCFSFSNQGDNGTVEPLCFKQIIDCALCSPFYLPFSLHDFLWRSCAPKSQSRRTSLTILFLWLFALI